MKILTGNWSFYVCSTLFALLFLAYLYLLDQPISAQDGLSAISEYGQTAIKERNYQKMPPLNYATGLLGGIVAGGFIAGLCGKKYRLKFKSEREGSSFGLIICGILGGFLMSLGSHIAGNPMLAPFTAAMELSTGGWLFLGICFLTAGAISLIWLNSREQQAEKPATPSSTEVKK